MVRKLKYDQTNTFFVPGKSGGLLVDTGYAGALPLFYKELKRNRIQLRDIAYILATHYHPDHMGLVSELMAFDIQLLLMDTQVDSIHFADAIFHKDKRLQYRPINGAKATVIRCAQSRDFLSALGIYGEIMATPSHSEDSVSLILDSGECMVGDLTPIDYIAAYDDNQALQNDWHHIMRYKPKRILYAHANERLCIQPDDTRP